MTWILPKQLHTLASALDTEALRLDSNEQSQICAQSLFVRSKPSQLRIWSAKWKRDSWTRHLSGRILKPSLGNRFADAWTSSLADILANPLARQESDKERTTRDISGHTSQGEFGFSNQDSASLRTSKDISAWGCPTSSKTWQEWVTERRGAYSARLNAERRTSESGCSSWPSPVASEVRQGFQDRSRGMKGSQESLTTVVVKTWATPSAREWKGHTITEAFPDGFNVTLSNQVHGQAVPASSSTDGSRPGLSWPTPQTMDVLPVRPVETFAESNRTRGGRKNRQALSNLREAIHSPVYQVKQWQTATVSTGAHKQKDGSMTDKLDQQVKNWSNGKLNPRWVETLMGLPVGWTMPSCASPVTIERMNSDCSGMELCRQPQNGPSEC